MRVKIKFLFFLFLLVVPISLGTDFNISLIPESTFIETIENEYTIQYSNNPYVDYITVRNNEGVNWTYISGETDRINESGTNGAYFNHSIKFNTTFSLGEHDEWKMQVWIMNQSGGTWGGLSWRLYLNNAFVSGDCGGSIASGNNIGYPYYLNATLLTGVGCNNTYFDEIRWQYQMTATQYRNFDHIFLPNLIDYGINNLPGFNITANSDMNNDSFSCLNSTKTEAVFTFNITTHDTEGDTIYYSPESYKEIQVETDYDFTGLGLALETDILDNYYNISGYCDVDTTILYRTDTHYFRIEYVTPLDWRWRLVLNSGCTGDDEFIYMIENPLVYSTAGQEFYIDDDEAIEVNYYDTELNLISSLLVNNTNDRTLVYNYNGTDFIEIYNISQTEYINVFTYVRNNTGDIDASVYLAGHLNLTQFSDDLVQFVGMKPYGNIEVGRFRVEGVIVQLDFTTTKPTSETYSNQGLFIYTLHVSDDIHQPNNYTSETLYLRVQDCGEYLEPLISGDVGSLLFYNLGNPIRELIEVMGWEDLVGTALWIFGIVCFIMLLFLGRNMNFALIVTGIVGILLSWVIDFRIHLYGFIIIFVLGIIGPIVKLFTGD